MAKPTLADQIEAILFVAPEPISAKRLAQATGAEPAAVDTALQELDTRLHNGIRLSRLGGEYRLVTSPETAGIVRQFLQDESKNELSRPALETLAIIAYRGPLPKSAIEHIRGVASDTMLRNLLARGLITEAGRSTEPGRPPLYAISHTFLQHFGLTSLSELPPVPELPDPSGTQDEN